MADFPQEGYYHLYSKKETEPCLVHGYVYEGEFIFGFNIHDGGGWVGLNELTDDSWDVRVSITES